ncbi:MAG: TetR family transcriptional regulator [Microbacterium sp.]|uniref:TetR family transcriptional regulator n=1 Tax=Microbacterium sp. TaxID=51671 RepID=UPI003F803733
MARAEGGRRHTRDDVARTALRLLDEEGLQELSMRRLAAALDVQASALYWHFPNKQTLLADVADRIVGEATAPPRQPDASALRAEAFALRDALLAHRDGAEVVLSTLALGLGARTAQERLAAAAVADGYDPEVSERAAIALLRFVIGHVSFEQQRQQYDRFGLVTPGAHAADEDPAADFAFGVGLLLDGLDRRR